MEFNFGCLHPPSQNVILTFPHIPPQNAFKKNEERNCVRTARAFHLHYQVHSNLLFLAHQVMGVWSERISIRMRIIKTTTSRCLSRSPRTTIVREGIANRPSTAEKTAWSGDMLMGVARTAWTAGSTEEAATTTVDVAAIINRVARIAPNALATTGPAMNP